MTEQEIHIKEILNTKQVHTVLIQSHFIIIYFTDGSTIDIQMEVLEKYEYYLDIEITQ